MNRLKLFIQKSSYAQLSIYGLLILVSMGCIVLSPWTLCFFKPKICLGLFQFCCRTKPVPALLHRCLIEGVNRSRNLPTQNHTDNHIEMLPLTSTHPPPTAPELSAKNHHATPHHQTPPAYHSLAHHMPRLSQSPQWSVPIN